ncbi:MAG TPA: indole-3-glycerol phosphate synthase TrpC [Anaerovoracaceae bacterium]|nr:indole-3-glycerol phosphate synthase TrpC [Anaerovoracaceae bacterium]
MTDILNKIAARSRERVKERKAQKSLIEISREAEDLCTENPEFPFEKALRTNDMAFICEVKKASPSKGILDDSFPYLEIAVEYMEAGAAAISVLTEPYWFLGSDEYLKEIRGIVDIPILRKDFTVDNYQIFEAKILGADAILLICALLDPIKLKEYIKIAHELGLSALVETHTEDEIRDALEAGARVIGVNNRDLKTFEVDIATSIRLRNLVPEDILFISESGIRTPGDIAKLKENKVDGVLIGETLMKSKDKKQRLTELRGELQS